MPPENLTDYPYFSGRRVVMGQRGAVATSQPLAALAGMEMLMAGGNAVDAAIAMAIALTVVEPTSNGIGSDAFALVWDGQLHGLNASGKSPQQLNLDAFVGMEQFPDLGWLTVTVPGAVSGWQKLWKRWGKLPFEQLFLPAIRYAEEGFPVSPETARAWKRAEAIYLPLTAPEFQPFKEVFFPGNRAPAAGEIWRSQVHAKTLRAIAQTEGESFYRGEIAEKIANFAANTGGILTASDLATHSCDWVQPIFTNYRGITVWEIPPNTQGIATLMALNILEGYPLPDYPRESVSSYHLQIEAMKLAFADLHQYIGDPQFMEVPLEHLLNKAYADERRCLIGKEAAIAQPGLPKGGTVYLAAADGELMVSFIQSNYSGFGSGILVPDTGIALQNRASGFTLTPEHPNQVAAAKRPFHTIIPGFLTQDNQPLGPFGVMGAPMQPQGHLQVVVNLLDYGMNPQAALDAPRWRFVAGKTVLLEQMVPRNIALALAERGHDIQISAEPGMFGKGQIILRQGGVLVAASEPRADGLALAW
ncbi:gamma-glutamyltransferase family protein [Coleofasciculus sp. FACHB-1120]|uniref:gamma-glutamyltransferase family protein n=1 Tax=Coleofasciculus sp. FACHB-1120 TaxID=2692783 RepID=UPI001688474F|nr:gamma-glutamyltransferase family protein [Coleofasciculus sp. FACHB-1120]MBD2744446.1 gamma-glutamyltransferase family protein [Coleofasciculus sp. FACHB-1120]